MLAASSGSLSARWAVKNCSVEWIITINLSAFSAFDEVDGEAAKRGFLVFRLHVGAGLAHGPDHLVERDVVPTVAAQGEARGVDCLGGADGVAFDAGNLDQ